MFGYLSTSERDGDPLGSPAFVQAVNAVRAKVLKVEGEMENGHRLSLAFLMLFLKRR